MVCRALAERGKKEDKSWILSRGLCQIGDLIHPSTRLDIILLAPCYTYNC